MFKEITYTVTYTKDNEDFLQTETIPSPCDITAEEIYEQLKKGFIKEFGKAFFAVYTIKVTVDSIVDVEGDYNVGGVFIGDLSL